MNTLKGFGAALSVVGAAGIIALAPHAQALPGPSAPPAPMGCDWNVFGVDVGFGCVGRGPAPKPTPTVAKSAPPEASLLLPCSEVSPPPGQKCDSPQS